VQRADGAAGRNAWRTNMWRRDPESRAIEAAPSRSDRDAVQARIGQVLEEQVEMAKAFEGGI
jgi:hypothetical protein